MKSVFLEKNFRFLLIDILGVNFSRDGIEVVWKTSFFFPSLKIIYFHFCFLFSCF